MTLVLAIVVAAYGYAWWRAGRAARLGCFVAGVAALWVAMASPIAELDRVHLTAHMVQHLLIMTVAAPLLLLGEPARVFLHGRRRPLSWSPPLALCWLAGTVVVLVWHVPALFELGMRWHGLPHATFLVGGLLFWLPVIAPWPIAVRGSRWAIPVYLFLATMPCDALSAFLAFCGRVVYPGHSGLDDQALAGALMWFWVTVAYLVPAVLVTLQILSPSGSEHRAPRRRRGERDAGEQPRRSRPEGRSG